MVHYGFRSTRATHRHGVSRSPALVSTYALRQVRAFSSTTASFLRPQDQGGVRTPDTRRTRVRCGSSGSGSGVDRTGFCHSDKIIARFPLFPLLGTVSLEQAHRHKERRAEMPRPMEVPNRLSRITCPQPTADFFLDTCHRPAISNYSASFHPSFPKALLSRGQRPHMQVSLETDPLENASFSDWSRNAVLPRVCPPNRV